MQKKMITLVLSVLALAGSALADPGTWTIDTAHSSARFSVRHMMLSDASGRLGPVSGTVIGDPAKPKDAVVDVTIDAKGLNTDVEQRDKHLRSADFFDVEKYPTITFKSNKVVVPRRKNPKMKVMGDLTMHGVTRPVVLNVDAMSPVMKDPKGNSHIGIKVTSKLNRQDFGVSWSKTLDGGGMVVSNNVDVVIDLELVKKAPEAAGALPAPGK